MKKLMCLIEVPNKYNLKEVYKVGEVYEFNDERAKEVLSARTKVSNEPYFVEMVDEIPEGEELVEKVVIEEKPKRKKRK